MRKGLREVPPENLVQLLNLPPSIEIGKAIDDGGCFFDALAQALNAIGSPQYNTEKSLRLACHDYYMKHKAEVDVWHQADYGGLDKGHDDYYLVQYTARELERGFNGRAPIWGRGHVEGRILCDSLALGSIQLIELINNPENTGQIIPCYICITADNKSRSYISFEDYTKVPTVVVGQESLHCIPLLVKPKPRAVVESAAMPVEEAPIPMGSEIDNISIPKLGGPAYYLLCLIIQSYKSGFYEKIKADIELLDKAKTLFAIPVESAEQQHESLNCKCKYYSALIQCHYGDATHKSLVDISDVIEAVYRSCGSQSLYYHVEENVSADQLTPFQASEDNFIDYYFLRPLTPAYFELRASIKKKMHDDSSAEDMAWSQYVKGLILIAHGRFRKAVAFFKQAIAGLDVDSHPCIRFFYGFTHQCLGDFAQANENYQIVVRNAKRDKHYANYMPFIADFFFSYGDIDNTLLAIQIYSIKYDNGQSAVVQDAEGARIDQDVLYRQANLFYLYHLEMRIWFVKRDFSRWQERLDDVIKYENIAYYYGVDENKNAHTALRVIVEQWEFFLGYCYLQGKLSDGIDGFVSISEKLFLVVMRAAKGNKMIVDLHASIGVKIMIVLLTYSAFELEEKILRRIKIVYLDFYCQLQASKFSNRNLLAELKVAIDKQNFRERLQPVNVKLALQENTVRKEQIDALEKTTLHVIQEHFNQEIVCPQKHFFQASLDLERLRREQIKWVCRPMKIFSTRIANVFDRIELCMMDSEAPNDKLISGYYARVKSMMSERFVTLDAKKELPVSFVAWAKSNLNSLLYQMYQRQLLFLFSLINSQQDNVRVLELCTNAEEVNLCLMDLQPKQAGSEAEACLSVQLQWQNPVPSVIRAVQTKKTAILLSDTELVKDYLHRKREETESLTRDDPLCVYYGKENTPIRFPYNINTSLEQLRKRRRIEETRNVASCSIGILHSKGVYVKGKKQAKVFSRMVVCSHYDAESYSSQHGPAIHHFERTKAGYKVYQEHLKASGKWTIDDSLNVISYSPLHHLHSEQMICDYLDGLTMGNFFQQFADKNEKLQFVKGCKIYAVTIDIESTNSSCLNCKMAFLAMLRPNPSLKKSFIKKFALHARGKYVLAGNKRNENNLHCVVRVLGNRQYKTKNYQNPDESNIKKLNNLGVFEMVRDQSQAPTVFVSGSK